jgi:uncharacterized protein (TIGR03435 family)
METRKIGRLSIHREEKPMQDYALLLAKGGPKLQESKDESVRGFKGSRKMVLAAQGGSMSDLAGYLAGPARGPVVDVTGLRGRFDIVLDLSQVITPEAQREGGIPAAISIGLQEQLGLKLEARKVPIPVIVVDHADKAPTDNE